MEARLDWQAAERICEECAVSFPVVRGSVYDGDTPSGLYLVALHGHGPMGRLAHLAVALLGAAQVPAAVALVASSTEDEFQFSLVEWSGSPWLTEKYLGTMLTPGEARLSPLKSDFFHVADHIVADLPQVREYLQ